MNMRIINKIPKKIDHSQLEYHRIMFNHYCNQLSNSLGLYEFQRSTGFSDKKGVKIFEGDKIEDVLQSGKIGIVKYGLYYNCFDKKEVKEFGGHVGFYVDFNDDKIRKDLFYWAKNSIVVKI